METPPVQFVRTSDGYDIAYVVCGEGRPIVCTWPPFFSSTVQAWKTQQRLLLESIARRFKLVHYDSRGTGNSSRGLQPDHSQQHYLLDIEAIVSRTGLDDLVLFGIGEGAHTSIKYAAYHPERVTGLVLWNAALSAWDVMRHWESAYANSWEMFLTGLLQTFGPSGSSRESLAILLETTTQADFLLVAKALAVSDVQELLPSLRIPTLVMNTREPAWPELLEAARTYASALPDARLVLFDEPRMEAIWSGNPEPPVMPVIEEFVAGLSPAKARYRESATSVAPPETLSGLGTAEPHRPAGLSIRETDVLTLVGRGKTNPEIADELVISRNTVQNHVKSIFRKIKVTNRAQAALYARDHDLT